MKFVLNPTLKHIALVKIVVSLWNQNDVRVSIVQSGFPELLCPIEEKWIKIEEKVRRKVQHLSLPHTLKVKLFSFIKPIGVQILRWIKHHSINFDLYHLPAKFLWTPQGRIDTKKTAEGLIKNENLDISTRYKLACTYCFEDDINKLWKNMPEHLRESISKTPGIIKFWSCNMRGRRLDHISYGSEFITQSVCLGNQVGTKYFLQKLTPSGRERLLVTAAVSCCPDADVLWLLLSEMEEEQRIKVFKQNPSGVLSCFLEFPMQRFFLHIANCIWDFLSVKNFNDVLRNIVTKDTHGYEDWNYQKLFREFWQKSPNTLKNSIANDIQGRWFWLLPSLFGNYDKENIRLILKDASPMVREKLINNKEMYKLCFDSIHARDWDYLKFYIRECFLSENEMLKFKEKFEKSFYFKCPDFQELFARNKQKWDQLFIFSDDSPSKSDKRSVEEGECSSSKQFRSQQ